MRLLDRYLLRELLVPLCYCLSGFLIFWITFDLFRELGDLQESKMRFGDILQYYLIKAPEFLVLVLPMALLLALLYSLTNHARHHEITAIRAAGLSLWRLALPYFAVGLLASITLFLVNELWVPNSVDAAELIKNRRLPRPANALPAHQKAEVGIPNEQAGRTWKIGVYDLVSGEMKNPQVLCSQPDGTRRWVLAERAIYTNDVWVFYNVREFKDAANPHEPLLIPVLQTNMLAFPEFTETPDQIKSEIRLSSTISIGGSRRSDVPVSEILNYLRLHPKPSRSDRYWLYTKLHGRLAAPWTCLVVVLIALPFGAASGRRNVFVGVAGSIFICFGYFIVQQIALAFGTGGYVPSWLAAWFPNIAFGTTGIWLTTTVR